MVTSLIGLMVALSVVILALGFYVLIKSANYLIEGASALAHTLKVPDIAIGLTIVAFGTSAPELIVNVVSSVNGHHEMCFGNVLGSNIFNTLVVLGFAAIMAPLEIKRNTVRKEIPFILIGCLAVFGMANNFGFAGHVLSRVEGLFLVAALFGFLVYVVLMSKETAFVEVDIHEMKSTKAVWLIILGCLGLFLGGNMVVYNAINIGRMLHVSEKFIGLTVVALGTSLPELVTSVVAVTKKRGDLAVGNVIGSNLFNILMVLGLTSVINPINYDVMLNYDFIFLILITLIMYITFLTGKKKHLNRLEGISFLILYGIYITFLINRG
ncbi:MAG: calcium/sodium antiporter [Candidatus Cloacimonetes bacterium]|nr:calcium/sodium antiporter [Candidatus Cloacimonadota bacterium]